MTGQTKNCCRLRQRSDDFDEEEQRIRGRPGQERSNSGQTRDASWRLLWMLNQYETLRSQPFLYMYL